MIPLFKVFKCCGLCYFVQFLLWQPMRYEEVSFLRYTRSVASKPLSINHLRKWLKTVLTCLNRLGAMRDIHNLTRLFKYMIRVLPLMFWSIFRCLRKLSIEQPIACSFSFSDHYYVYRSIKSFVYAGRYNEIYIVRKKPNIYKIAFSETENVYK